MGKLSSLQQQIYQRMSGGTSLDEVQGEVDGRADLSDEEKAALWLYARSFVPNTRARLEAMEFIRALEPKRG
jgi:hypothetical protein